MWECEIHSRTSPVPRAVMRHGQVGSDEVVTEVVIDSGRVNNRRRLDKVCALAVPTRTCLFTTHLIVPLVLMLFHVKTPDLA